MNVTMKYSSSAMRSPAIAFIWIACVLQLSFCHSIEHQRYRQYGLWERFNDLYPKDDLIYTVGTSNFSRDWFFAHVPRFGMCYWAGVGFSYITILLQCVRFALAGDYAHYLSFVSDAAYVHTLFNIGGYHRPF